MVRQRHISKKDRGQTIARVGWILVAIYLWVVVGLIIFKVDPGVIRDVGVTGLYVPLLVIVFGAVWVTMGTIRWSVFKGLVWALAVAGFLGLRFFGLGHWLNLLLIVGLLSSCEYYWHTKRIDKPGD